VKIASQAEYAGSISVIGSNKPQLDGFIADRTGLNPETCRYLVADRAAVCPQAQRHTLCAKGFRLKIA
jgi:hypothetical protein